MKNKKALAPQFVRETAILYDVLFSLKIEDMNLEYRDGELVATDEWETWHGAELYDFLVNEAFVFEDDGGVLGISKELLEDFAALSELYGVPVKKPV